MFTVSCLRSVPVAALTVAFALPTGAQQTTLIRETSVEGITAYRMPGNGLRVLLYPDPSKPQTLVNLTYMVGSRHEGSGETGMAHLLEHMLFKPTTTRADIPREIETHGAQYNASTSFDRTNYFELFSAADTTLEWAIAMEADRMVNSRVAKVDLDKEFSVVRSEYESGENNPTLVTIKRVLGSAYLFHPYGHLPIGSQSDIERVPIDRLQAFYHKYYQPDNAILTIAGKFDSTKALALVQKYFGAVPRPARQLAEPYTEEPVQDGERDAWVRRAGNEQDIVAFYHSPAGSSSDYPAVEVLEHILTDAPSGRLYKALVETKKAASVGALPLQLHDPAGIVLIVSMRKEDNLDAARAAMLKTIEELTTTSPPTAEEVERVKNSIGSGIALSLNNTASIGLALSEWMAVGDWRLFFLHRDQVKKVTPADVKHVAAAYLKSANRTLGYFVPTDNLDRSVIAAAPDVAALVKDYKGEAAAAAGEEFDPSPANITSRTREFTTKAGLKVALLPKKTKGENVNVAIVLRYGSEQTLQGRSDALGQVGTMLMRGTTKHTRQQLRDSLDALKARMGVGGGSSSVQLTVQTTRSNLPAVLTLANEVLRMPSFDSTEFGAMMREQIAGIEAQAKEPTALAPIAAQRKVSRYPKGDPRYVDTPEEALIALRALTAADLRKAYADFYGASAGEISIVGDFDESAARAQLDTMFAGWKSKSPFIPLKNVVFDVKAEHQDIDTPDKANAIFVAVTTFPLSDHDPDYPAMLIANYIMGGGGMTSRLTARIRVKDGLSYAAQSGFNADRRDQSGVFQGVAIYAPQNGDKVQQAFFEEIDRARKDGFTADELEKAKTGLLQSNQLSRAQDQVLAGQLITNMSLGRSMQYAADLDQKIQATTIAQVNAAFKKYVDPSRIVTVRAGDLSKAKQPVPPKP